MISNSSIPRLNMCFKYHRILHVLVIIVIFLICSTAGQRKRCWTKKGGQKYSDTVQKSHKTLELCLESCQNEYPNCLVASYKSDNYIWPCYLQESSDPVSESKFSSEPTSDAYILDRACLAARGLGPDLNCWVSMPKKRYHGLYHSYETSFKHCLDYCKFQVPQCLIINFASTEKWPCWVMNDQSNVDSRNFENYATVDSFQLDRDCMTTPSKSTISRARFTATTTQRRSPGMPRLSTASHATASHATASDRAETEFVPPDCWIVKPSTRYIDVIPQDITTVEACLIHCQHVAKGCIVVNFDPSDIPPCWTNSPGPLVDTNFEYDPDISTYLLDRSCTDTPPVVKESSGLGKWLIFFIIAIIILILSAFLFLISQKESNSTTSRSSETSESSSDSGSEDEALP